MESDEEMSERRRKLLVYFMILLVLFCIHSNTVEVLSVPSPENLMQHAGESSIMAVTAEEDFNCLPSSGAAIRSIKDNIRLYVNFRTRQTRSGNGISALLFAIVFTMVLFPYLIYSITIHMYGRCTIPLWKVICYIHLLDGKKENARIRI